MLPVLEDSQDDKIKGVFALEVEASITGEAQRQPDRTANGISNKTTKGGSLKRTRSQYGDEQSDLDQSSILADFAAIVAEHGWEFDVKLGEDTAASSASLKRWLDLEKRSREKNKTSFKVVSPRGTTITKTGIHQECDFKCKLEILRPQEFQPSANEGDVPCLRLVEVSRSPSPPPVHVVSEKEAEAEESEEDPDGENVHNLRINPNVLWNIKNPKFPQRYVSPSDPFSFYPGPGRYQGI